MDPEKMYPRTDDRATVYLKSVVKNPNIIVGDFTMYHDFVKTRGSLNMEMCCITIRLTMTDL